MDWYGFTRTAIFGGGPLRARKEVLRLLHECTAVYASTSSGRLPLVESNHPRTQGRRRECLTSRLLSVHNCMPLGEGEHA